MRLVFLILVCGALLFGVLWAAGARPVAGVPVPVQPTPGAVASAPIAVASPDATAAASAERKIRAAASAARSAPAGSHRPITLTLTQPEVNALLAQQVADDPNFPLQQPSVALGNGVLVLTGGLPFGPKVVPVTITGAIAVEDGVPRYVVNGVNAGGVPLPAAIVDQLKGEIDRRVSLTPADLPVTVQTATVTDQAVTLTGVTK